MQIIGHQKQLNILNKSIERGNVAQAYLFSGPEKVGKFTVALDFAQKLTGSEKELNPNIYILKPEVDEEKNKKLEIKIEQIKDLQHWLSLSAFENQTKVAIIDDAQKMNKTAQNALLKTLEDARIGTVVILVTQNEEKIYPTVISRCYRLKFGTVSEKELSMSINKEIGEDIIFWSLGRPGLFQKLINEEAELTFRQETLTEFMSIFSKNVAEKMVLAEELSQNIERTLEKMNLWQVIIREATLNENFVVNLSAEKKINWLDQIEKSRNLILTTNANSRLILENLLINI